MVTAVYQTQYGDRHRLPVRDTSAASDNPAGRASVDQAEYANWAAMLSRLPDWREAREYPSSHRKQLLMKPLLHGQPL